MHHCTPPAGFRRLKAKELLDSLKLKTNSQKLKASSQELNMSILMVTGIEGARDCAAVVAAQLGMQVEVAEGRRAALAALRSREFLALVIDETLAECDPAAAEKICENAGLAIPMQINFAVSGAARLYCRSAAAGNDRNSAHSQTPGAKS
jgi:hypothetical protein